MWVACADASVQVRSIVQRDCGRAGAAEQREFGTRGRFVTTLSTTAIRLGVCGGDSGVLSTETSLGAAVSEERLENTSELTTRGFEYAAGRTDGAR
jgi:hypothetical protein